ncbi:MAG: flagella accessory protein C [Candidatus Micrarchaeota archaeon]
MLKGVLDISRLPFGLGGTKQKDEKPKDTESEAPDKQEAGEIEIGMVQESAFDNTQLEDIKKQVAVSSERASELEEKLNKAEKAISIIKKENEQLKGRMDQNDSRILDMLSVYEVVSNQINPFVGSSKVLSSTVEQLQNELTSLKKQVSTMGADLKIMSHGRVNISRLVRSTISEQDKKRRVDLTKLIRSAVQSKRIVKSKKGELEYDQ